MPTAERPEPPYMQIADDIRRQIRSGQLRDGDLIPSTRQLARAWKVAPPTAAKALRLLRSEGYVRGVPGAGTVVRAGSASLAVPAPPEQASLPAASDRRHPLAGMATFLFEMGHLKQLPRSGWLLLGIPQPESVAEHSFRVAVIGVMLAAMEGADVGRTTALCLLHDAHETRIGDVPSLGRAYVTTAMPEAVTAHQTSGMPESVAKALQELTVEYEATETTESQLAHDADKIEMLLQAIEYQTQGYDTEPWRETALAALRTDAGRQLAQAIGEADPRWWALFAASYAELRAR
jgi:putative hydrolases of HD superfamily